MAKSREDDFVTSLRADVVRVLTETSGAPEPYVMSIASQIVRAVVQRYQGERPYIGATALAYDEDAVLQDFTYNNHREVCDKHGISRSTLWRIVQRRSSSPKP